MSKQERQQKLATLWMQQLRANPFGGGHGRCAEVARLLGVHRTTISRDLRDLRAAAKGR